MAKAKKTAKPVKKPAAKAKKSAKRRAAGAPVAPAKLTAEDLRVTVTEAEREGWTAAAASLAPDEVLITTPFAVLTGESVDVAKFARAHWAPETDRKTKAVVVPGLSSAVTTGSRAAPFAPAPVLHEGTAQEILVLNALTQEAQTRVLLAARSSGGVAHPRLAGDLLLSDLRALAESFLDDGVETDEDAQLRAVNDAHADDAGTDDALAGALTDYATFVETLRPAIDDYADFSPTWVERARALAAELRVAPARPASEAKADGALLDARNRLATLLLRRMRMVRAKARFVFRKHPTLVREVTSVYERRRRSERRAAAKKADAKTVDAKTAGATTAKSGG